MKRLQQQPQRRRLRRRRRDLLLVFVVVFAVADVAASSPSSCVAASASTAVVVAAAAAAAVARSSAGEERCRRRRRRRSNNNDDNRTPMSAAAFVVRQRQRNAIAEKLRVRGRYSSSAAKPVLSSATVVVGATKSAASAAGGGGNEQRAKARPIDPTGWPGVNRFPAKRHCSRCGLCETTHVRQVREACAFLDGGMRRNVDALEPIVHGRSRRNFDGGEVDNLPPDEGRFGVLYEPMKLVRGVGMQRRRRRDGEKGKDDDSNDVDEAQWTGAVTGIAVAALESGAVDAVVCIANAGNSDFDGDNNNDGSTNNAKLSWCVPEPIVARTPEEVLRGRGVKPSLAPSLAVLDDIRRDPTIKRLLFCGVGCAVQAFRAVQSSLTNLEEVYVLGTNCVDNSPTPEAAERFVREGFGLDPTVHGRPRGYEFMQDFKVHVKTDTGAYLTKPYFSLPGTIAEQSIAASCLACTDYTNALADAVVGYMAAPLKEGARMDQSLQTLSVRNARGAKMVETAVRAGRLDVVEGVAATGRGGHEQLAVSTVQSDAIVQSIVGGKVPDAGIPRWIGEILAYALRTFVAPTGVNFARYSIDYHLLRNYLYMLDVWGEERTQESMPRFARDIVRHYVEASPVMAQLKSKVIAKRSHEVKPEDG